MKKSLLVTSLFMALMMLLVFSCRESFEEEFRVVPIVNNPPTLDREIGTIEYIQGFESEDLDLARYVSDLENDPISYLVSSSDESIVTVATNGSLITFTEGVALGTSTISVDASDGNEGNDIAFTFEVEVIEAPAEGPKALFYIDFDVPDGTAVDENYPLEGVSLIDSYGTMTVFGGQAEFTDEGRFFLEFDPTLDISANPVIRFDYSNSIVTADQLYVEIMDNTYEGFADNLSALANAPTIELGSSGTVEIDLSSLSGSMDLSNLLEFYIEIEGTGTMTIDNIELAPPLEPLFIIDFEVDDGTAVDESYPVEGVSVIDSYGSMTVFGGQAEFTDEGRFFLEFDPTLDISANPVIRFDYSNSIVTADQLYVEIMDNTYEGFADNLSALANAPTIELGSSGTVEIDLSSLSGSMDLSNLLEFYIEIEGTGTMTIDNVVVGLK